MYAGIGDNLLIISDSLFLLDHIFHIFHECVGVTDQRNDFSGGGYDLDRERARAVRSSR